MHNQIISSGNLRMNDEVYVDLFLDHSIPVIKVLIFWFVSINSNDILCFLSS